MVEGIIAVGFIITAMLFAVYFDLPSALDPSTETITVITGNKTLLSQETLIGKVTGSKVFNDNRTEIQFKLGTTFFGFDNNDSIVTYTNQTFAPDDNIKIMEKEFLGSDCKYYFQNGTEISEPRLFFKRTTGDFCGIYIRYEVELLK